MIKAEPQPSPVEVWLTRGNMEITCRVVHEDETTRDLTVDSVSMRGAMREVTGHFVEQGYKPAGRWTIEAEDRDEVLEASRKFKWVPPAEEPSESPEIEAFQQRIREDPRFFPPDDDDAPVRGPYPRKSSKP